MRWALKIQFPAPPFYPAPLGPVYTDTGCSHFPQPLERLSCLPQRQLKSIGGPGVNAGHYPTLGFAKKPGIFAHKGEETTSKPRPRGAALSKRALNSPPSLTSCRERTG